MRPVEHRLLWSTRYPDEHHAVMEEAKRVALQGGTFLIRNEWFSSNWYTFITIFYPDKYDSTTKEDKET